jgi:hypothetical protein
MKRFLMTIVLTCLLSVSALAGEVPTVGVASPPPSAPGDGHTPGAPAPAPGDVPSVGIFETVVLTIISLLPS